jgi:tripartite ATP-independent transporter DctM subunit
MQSKLLGTNMVRRGYDAPFAAAIVAASAVITPIIPPGLGFVIYGYLANVSVGRLFVAGVVPGILLAGSIMTVTHWIAKRRGYKPSRAKRAGPRELLEALREAAWALTVPIFIILGLRYGLFTPTEAGAVIVVYAVLIGAFVYRELKLSATVEILTEAGLATAAVMIIISAADALGYYMTLEQLPIHAAEFLTSLTRNPLLMLIIINAFLLVLGMFLESLAALILVTPVLAPVGLAVGIDPVHLGLIIVLNLTIGAITPPVGTLMFISCGVLGVRITDYTRSVLPLLGAQIVVLLLLVVFPVLVIGLPNLLMGITR